MPAVQKEFTASEARARFAEVFDAAFHDGPVVIRKNSKSVALVNIELLQMLTKLEETYEALQAEKALEEFDNEGGITLKDLKQELGID